MSEVWDDRKKAMEEDYFRRKEQEALEKMQAKVSAEQNVERLASIVSCPKCDGSLSEISFEEVLIDRCEKCGGIWLDAGELERLVNRKEGGWLSRMRKSLVGD